jgi:hypothetical protein
VEQQHEMIKTAARAAHDIELVYDANSGIGQVAFDSGLCVRRVSGPITFTPSATTVLSTVDTLITQAARHSSGLASRATQAHTHAVDVRRWWDKLMLTNPNCFNLAGLT